MSPYTFTPLVGVTKRNSLSHQTRHQSFVYCFKGIDRIHFVVSNIGFILALLLRVARYSDPFYDKLST